MCSLRSCPTQNPRPVPVSTTQRTASSAATAARCRAAAPWWRCRGCSSTSGRLRVIGGDAVVDAQQDTGPVMDSSGTRSCRPSCGPPTVGGSCADSAGCAPTRRVLRRLACLRRLGQELEGPRDELVGGGLQPLALELEEGVRPVTGPVGGEQLGGQAGVGEEELAPLVHELEARGEGRLVGVVVRGEVGRRSRPPHCIQSAYAVASALEVPRLHGRVGRREVMGDGGGRAGSRRGPGSRRARRRERADPDQVGHLGVAEEREVAQHRGPGGRRSG